MSSSAHFRRTELPLSLEYDLRSFITRFPHGGPAVESYLKQEPCTEWTPFFVHIIGCVLRGMIRDRRMQDNQEQLVLAYPPEALSVCQDRLLADENFEQIDHLRYHAVLALEECGKLPFWRDTEVHGWLASCR